MKIMKNKISAMAVSILFMLSMAASTMLIPNATAHSPGWQVPTYMYVSVSPNPIGVGQTVYVNFWLNCPPPTAIDLYGDRFQNLTVQITKPDGTTQTLGPFVTDDTGGTSTTFTPTAAGNYTFEAFFGGQTLTGANPPPGGYSATQTIAIGDYYEPSQSSPFTLTVQQTPISSAPATPLPTSYWARPIYATNTNWYSIAGNWLGLGMGNSGTGIYNATGNYNPYTTAPTTSHILWTKAEAFGGLVGGEFGGTDTSNFYSTRQYETMFEPIIIGGILYYTSYPSSTMSPSGITAVNLQTGQTIWTSDSPLTLPSAAAPGGATTTLSPSTSSAGACTILKTGQLLDFVSPNQYGSIAYLWTTGTPAIVAAATNIAPGSLTYNMFDALTGDYILSIVNGTSFNAITEDQNGNLICYYINSTNPSKPMLGEWNSTQAIMTYGFATGELTALSGSLNAWTWRPPQGAIIPFSDGIEWLEPIATQINGNAITLGYSGISSGVVLLDQYSSVGGSAAFQAGWIIEAGYSTTTGAQLWLTNRTEPVNTRIAFGYTGNGNSGFAIGDGVFVECNLDTLSVTGYSLFTGTQLWGPVSLPNANPWGSLGLQQIVANGTIYVWTLGGDVYSIDILTGAVNWHYQTPSSTTSPYGVEPLWESGGRGVVAGGLLILGEGHEFAPPLFSDAQQLALNLTNGHLVWSILGFFVNGDKAVSDGILTDLNAYDNQIYAFGMGPSATTVTAPDIGITTSTPITITGTVMDNSAGAQQQAVAANFPHGLPCVSDASMSSFMEAVYMQQPMPNNITGVPVTLSVLDSNGNYRTIGTTTTDASGSFSYTWTPDIPGNFTIYATFAGTGAYYGSSAETHIYASSPSASTPTPPPVASNFATTTDLTMGIAALAVVIVIIGAVLALIMLRKRQ